MRHFGRLTAGPLLRIAAAGALLLWLGALMLCTSECDLNPSHAAAPAVGRAAAVHHPSSPTSDRHGSHEDSFCRSLKSGVRAPAGMVVARPDFGSAWTPVVVSPAQLLSLPDVEAPVSGQPPDRERLLTPEVSLGPAFRSLAPPLAVLD